MHRLYLPQYPMLCRLDFDVINTVLADWETFSSAAGVGLSISIATNHGGKSIILEVDPPDHNVTSVYSTAYYRGLQWKNAPDLCCEAAALVMELVARKSFDGVKDLAEVYPLKVFPDAVGLNKVDGKICWLMELSLSTQLVHAIISSKNRCVARTRSLPGS